uniref:hypothetical protein n=1 Tax=Streptococcus equi TaxID=1336 RepID=UPI001969A7B4
GKNNFYKYFDNLITPDKVIYFNKERGQELNALAKLQLLRSYSLEPDLYGTIIRKPQCLVNSEQARKPVVSLSKEVSSVRQAHQELSKNQTIDKDVLDHDSR